MASPSRPTHERFIDSYAEAGIQPSTGVRKIRSVNESAANDPTVRRVKVTKTTNVSQPAANDTNYTKQQKKRKVPKLKTLEQLKQGDFDEVLDEILDGIDEDDEAQLNQEAKKRGVAVKVLKAYLLYRAYLRVSKANMRIFSIGMYMWVTFQVPIAILSLLALGLSVVLAEIKDSINTAAESGNRIAQVFATAVSAIGNLLTAANNAFLKITGIDLSLFSPDNLFFTTYIVIWAWGITILVLMYLIYKMLFLNPLDGKGAGFKIGMLLLAIVGYSVPLLNLLPWHMAWGGAVWVKPK